MDCGRAGADHIGRDYFSRLVYAGRISLTVAIISTSLATLTGMAVGVYAGYYGGWVDSVLMRAVEFLATIPTLPLLLVISAMLLRSENAIPIPQAALSFLGFGIQDPIPTWGNMLAASQQFMFDRPWLPLAPGIPIVLCSLAFNYIGDGLRDALDPRLKL